MIHECTSLEALPGHTSHSRTPDGRARDHCPPGAAGAHRRRRLGRRRSDLRARPRRTMGSGLARERRPVFPVGVLRPAPRSAGPQNRVLPPERKRVDGLERRPPAGIARERETHAHHPAPCQRACREPPSSGCRDRSLLPGAALFSCPRGVQENPIMNTCPRGAPRLAPRSGARRVPSQCRSALRALRPSGPRAGRRPAFQAVPAFYAGGDGRSPGRTSAPSGAGLSRRPWRRRRHRNRCPGS